LIIGNKIEIKINNLFILINITMFTTIYRPKNIEEFIGNKHLVQPFIEWLLGWDANDNIKNVHLFLEYVELEKVYL